MASSFTSWIAEHKLTSIGALWGTVVGASFVYNTKTTPLKPSLRLIHARMHAQALTLAVLSGAAMLHYYDNRNYAKAEAEPDITGNSNNSTGSKSSHSTSFDEEKFSWWI